MNTVSLISSLQHEQTNCIFQKSFINKCWGNEVLKFIKNIRNLDVKSENSLNLHLIFW